MNNRFFFTHRRFGWLLSLGWSLAAITPAAHAGEVRIGVTAVGRHGGSCRFPDKPWIHCDLSPWSAQLFTSVRFPSAAAEA